MTKYDDPEKGFDGPGIGYTFDISKKEAKIYCTDKKETHDPELQEWLDKAWNPQTRTLDLKNFPFGPIPHWIDPNDKLPENNQEVLTYCENRYNGPNATYPIGHKYFALDKYLSCGFRTEVLGYGKVLKWQKLPKEP